MTVEREPLAKTLAHLLRHQPGVHGITLDERGWAPVDDIVAKLGATRHPDLTRDDLERTVKQDPRKRFELRQGKVRARWGHSVPVDVGKVEAPPIRLYAAVSRALFRDAATQGLQPPKGRLWVHLSEDPEEAREVAQRKDPEPVLLEVHAKDAEKRGLIFRHTGPLWLVAKVPPEFLHARG